MLAKFARLQQERSGDSCQELQVLRTPTLCWQFLRAEGTDGHDHLFRQRVHEPDPTESITPSNIRFMWIVVEGCE